jgi:thiaminase
MPSLTSHLLSLEPVRLLEATQHPFLRAAATSQLSPAHLKKWLAQDRLYAMSYVNFIGTMLSRLPIPGSSQRDTTLEWRVADLLIDALVNIKRELKLFEDTAESEGWLEDICDAIPTPQTRAYLDLFAGAAQPSRPLVASLVALWATEECYLRSWRHAWSKMDHALSAKEKDVMQRVFIPNWSSSEFEAFVRRIGGLTNKYGATIEENGWEWGECEEVWRQVLWAEKNFWPDM